jgi:hypothetical protein
MERRNRMSSWIEVDANEHVWFIDGHSTETAAQPAVAADRFAREIVGF